MAMALARRASSTAMAPRSGRNWFFASSGTSTLRAWAIAAWPRLGCVVEGSVIAQRIRTEVSQVRGWWSDSLQASGDERRSHVRQRGGMKNALERGVPDAVVPDARPAPAMIALILATRLR